MTQIDPGAIQPDAEAVLVTIFLKHTQQLTLEQMTDRLRETGFWAKFPPDGVEVVSWYQLMSFGHVLTLKVPPIKVREVNRALEAASYTVFQSEVYLGYDFRPVVEAIKARDGL